MFVFLGLLICFAAVAWLYLTSIAYPIGFILKLETNPGQDTKASIATAATTTITKSIICSLANKKGRWDSTILIAHYPDNWFASCKLQIAMQTICWNHAKAKASIHLYDIVNGKCPDCRSGARTHTPNWQTSKPSDQANKWFLLCSYVHADYHHHHHHHNILLPRN